MFTLNRIILQNILLISVAKLCFCTPILLEKESSKKGWNNIREKRSPSLWGGKPPDKTCLNFCMFARCHNGHCIMNSDTCMINCVCFEGFTGRRCTVPIVIETDVISSPNTSFFLSTSTDESPIQSTEGSLDTSKRPTLRKSVKLPGSVLGKIFGIFTTSPSIKNEKHTNTSLNHNLDNKTLENTKQKGPDISNSKLLPILTSTESIGLSQSVRTETPRSTTDVGDQGLTQTIEEQVDENKDLVQSSYQSPYLDKCKENCINKSCVALNGSFHCLPDQHYCKNGFICENGVCDPTTITNQRYRCLCEPGYIGDTCAKKCDLDCGNYGVCVLHGKRKVCACDSKHAGKRCEKLIPKAKPLSEEKWYWYVVGSCIACLVLLLALMVFLPYWMWRKRWLFIVKIVHFFQHYEEDDGKLYDAFISYKSSKEDEDFVLHQLYPKLESEMGFKLCMHFRDFTPGDVIANNIIRAIEDSRRTIMVLSPNYVDSEWCRMEYQKAQQEMLKLKHKIIPVVFKDISQSTNIDKNLKTILKTVTYLEWPGEDNSKKLERFWKQLMLSLPKKHPNSSPQASPTLPAIVSNTVSQKASSFISSSIDTNNSNKETYSAPCDMDIPLPEKSAQNNGNTATSETAIDTTTNRLRKLMKDIVKLKITQNSRSFTRLNTEGSVDSCTPTPVSPTPSPGMYMSKDESPLISRKKNFPKHSKSSSWSEKTLQNSISHSIMNRSLREKEPSKTLDIIPHSPVNTCDHSLNSYLPDVCHSIDGSYFNILCEPETPDANEREAPSLADMHKDCNTCVISVETQNGNNECLTCKFPKEVDNTHQEFTKIINTNSGSHSSPDISNMLQRNVSNEVNHACSTCVFPCEVSNENYREDSNCIQQQKDENVIIEIHESCSFKSCEDEKCEKDINVDNECIPCVNSKVNNSCDVNSNIDPSNDESTVSQNTYNIPVSTDVNSNSASCNKPQRDLDRINCNVPEHVQKCVLLDNSQSESDCDTPRAPVRTKKLRRKAYN